MVPESIIFQCKHIQYPISLHIQLIEEISQVLEVSDVDVYPESVLFVLELHSSCLPELGHIQYSTTSADAIWNVISCRKALWENFFLEIYATSNQRIFVASSTFPSLFPVEKILDYCGNSTFRWAVMTEYSQVRQTAFDLEAVGTTSIQRNVGQTGFTLECSGKTFA
ncbi:hypothetical protein CYMTET_39841 [Cymbomonas tetramitiformis]|uniref:Uncharacterized protein n=1 Tax=Cymbomonas tetramitiformis TaxID=36881 RepID=A0AAE0CAN3_9CHLO|nr:hypothetical protein CYMTET_39844 [Cymbomonas tetramitiformis]KAK3250795.1 hypothetical protein CYMTET_39841 [Cymbomonas tetramitiformis]